MKGVSRGGKMTKRKGKERNGKEWTKEERRRNKRREQVRLGKRGRKGIRETEQKRR